MIYVSPSQVRKFDYEQVTQLKVKFGHQKMEKDILLSFKIETINFETPESLRQRINFDNLTPLYPENKINFEGEFNPEDKDYTPRIIDLVSPMEKGQRGLIVAATKDR